jgi:hypothetical protein
MLTELFLIRNPSLRWRSFPVDEFRTFVEDYCRGKPLSACGNWVLYPWRKLAVHCLPPHEFRELRTSRNRNLITESEQKQLSEAQIGIAGMSVGSQAAMAAALSGFERIKLADFDALNLSNLNRMTFTLCDLGTNKAELVARWIFELNPYAQIAVFNEGIRADNAADFVDGLDVLVEELDDILVKHELRLEAKRRGIPVVMATDNGDDVIIDIERFDLEPERPPFHGALADFDLGGMRSPTADSAKLYEAMARIIDLRFVPGPVLLSVLEVGRSLYTWPQLASAAMVAGGVVAFAVRQILLGKPIKGGKISLGITSSLDPEPGKAAEAQLAALRDFVAAMGWVGESWLPEPLRLASHS